LGRKNRPFYRIGAFDSRTRRDGSPIEYLGHYDPMVDEFEKSVVLDMDRVKHWIDNGAKCSDTVASFVQKKGLPLHRNARTSGPRTKGKGQASARQA
jgi:small subunit ribosomal protein S16